MKLRIHFRTLFFCVLLLATTLTSCHAPPSNADPSSTLSKTDSEKYVIQTPLYQIYEEGPYEYRYKIATSRKVFADDVKHGTEPEIDSISNGGGVIRLVMGFGTNASSLQYFDVWNDRTSEIFSPYSIYADYADTNTNECLVAYFNLPSSPGKNVLLIKDIFNEQGFSTEIDKGFISARCYRLIILNENELYLDYDVFADGFTHDDLFADKPVEFKNIREVVKFR